MADYEFPPDLLDQQRAYDAADARVQEVTDALPSAQDALEGAMTDEQKGSAGRGARGPSDSAGGDEPAPVVGDSRRPTRRQDGPVESNSGLTEDEAPRPAQKAGEVLIRVQLRH